MVSAVIENLFFLAKGGLLPSSPRPLSPHQQQHERDLKLRISDLQCAKFSYGGQKLRILGKVSSSVQCILDGRPAGNLYFKATVVQDLFSTFDTHSIAGKKLSEKLTGPPYVLSSEDNSETEPTTPKRRKNQI